MRSIRTGKILGSQGLNVACVARLNAPPLGGVLAVNGLRRWCVGQAWVGVMLGLLGLCVQAQPLTPCWLKGVPYEARCGVIQRPLDPAHAQGPRIEVHVAVLPALARNKQPDAVYFFAGGPGQSAIELAGPASQLLARLSTRRDIVLIDQRGTGRSAPLRCEEAPGEQTLAEQADLQQQVRSVRDCQRKLGRLPHGDLRFYTTPLAMADVDAVRTALQHERINLVGGSYGTRAALEYLRQFPQRVRRVVLDGVAPPDMVLPASFSGDNQRALEAMFLGCEQEAACARLHPRLRQRWQELLAQPAREVTAQHPVSGREERFRLSPTGMVQFVRGPLYVPALASALPYAIEEAAAGRFTPLVGLAATAQGSSRNLFLGMHFAVVCAEDYPRLSTTSLAPGVDFGEAFADVYRQVCASWPRGEVPAAFYAVGPAASPVLLLSGGLDPVTPPRHGERMAQALGARARHVVVAQAGHGVMSLACLREGVARFISSQDDSEALALDLACANTVPRPPAYQAPVMGRNAP
jgi:pimeloyl-ACP methyl ester carboxylesterase